MLKEFAAFLKQYGVIGLAIAVIIGGKLNDLISAFVNGLLMPIIGKLTGTASGDWREWKPHPYGINFEMGRVIGASIDFLIVAFIVFWMAKKILKEDVVTKK